MTENREDTQQRGPIQIIRAEYIASAVKQSQYPPMNEEDREFVFVGRSNVGKSSLINSLSRQHGLARTSGTPGKTQTLNFYQLTAKLDETRRQRFFLVDLPGYGYARTGREARRQWAKFIEEYLLSSPRIKLVCQLIDIRHKPMESDVLTYRWLEEQGLPLQVIATKADKISRMTVNKQLKTIQEGIGMRDGQILPYSSAKGTGRDQLLDVIGHLLLN
ncbi:ribosome biogenesis GTP-binding protein YihA/YsxC [Propionispora hippei]|uniref:Probable GTP-binding protein EngB n=1 Tax=Propionispora hippei DSM 15287 TaxID=1123003 RepID=A0A1M6A414_9FIRM|nr:ribosome biogenesis GTP-binding protein YihA/YsxC [Propionispora hippei]SHI31208.1 GTP-binding protein [Propionispora hippei DSM 15287]